MKELGEVHYLQQPGVLKIRRNLPRLFFSSPRRIFRIKGSKTYLSFKVPAYLYK